MEKTPIKSYKDLKVWQEADELVFLIYRLTKSFPEEERYNLISQLRRAAISVPANIVEGWYRYSTKEYVNFLYTALASSGEVQYLSSIAHRLGYIVSDKSEEIDQRAEKIGKMLRSLIKSLKLK